MRRHSSLAFLSREHQRGLAVALQLRRATVETAPAAEAAFLSFWDEEDQQHFRAEEELLLPAAARRLAPAHEAIVRVLVEHVDLRRRAAELARAAVAELEDLQALGERLEQHIRYEERVLFPLVEEALPSAELAELAAALARAEQPHTDGVAARREKGQAAG
jgi:hemerythrin-like domain-containing protein